MPHRRSRARYSVVQKSKLQGAYQYLVAKDIPFDVLDIFKCFGVRSERQGYNIIREVDSTPPGHDSDFTEIRDCNPTIASNQTGEAVHLAQEDEGQIKGITMHLESMGLQGKN
jgi:hypothetical protein